MKITIYELLGMIKDGKTPKRIIHGQYVYVWNSKIENYQSEVDETTTLNWDYITINCLNEPVEILNEILEEEKKIPEKLEDYDFDESLDANTKCECLRERMQEIENQLDELIDYLKSKGDE